MDTLHSNIFSRLSALLIVSILLYFSFGTELGDFGNYYFGSKFLSEGRWGSWIYDPGQFNQAIEHLGNVGQFLNYTPVPPITAVFYLPFTVLEPAAAKWVFNVLSIVLLVISLFRFAKLLGMQPIWVPAFLMVSLVPIKSNFDQGQSYVLILAFMLEGYMALERKQNWLSAFFWSIPVLLKIFPAILLLYLLFDKNYKQVGRLLVVCLVPIALSVTLLGVPVWTEYLIEILPRLLRGEINDPFSVSYQSVSVLLKKIFVHDSLLNPAPWLPSVRMFSVAEITFKIGVLYWLWRMLCKMENSFSRFALVLASGMLISGYGTTYSLLLFLPLLIYFTHQFPKQKWLLGSLFVCAFSISPYWFDEQSLLFQFPRLMFLIFIFCALTFTIQPSFHRLHVIAGLVLCLTWGWLNVPPANIGTWVESSSQDLLSVNYEINPDRILITKRNESGLKEVFVPLPKGIDVISNLPIVHDQIFLDGQQLTHTTDRKKKALLASDQCVYYLSDYGHGVGFYALRKVPLSALRSNEI